MKVKVLSVILFIYLGFLSFLIPFPVFAQDKFTTSAQTTYTVSDSGSTHVDAHIVIHNTTPNFYASSYTLELGFPTIMHVSAYDSGGSIVPQIEKDATGEKIHLDFNSVVYGANTSLPFTLSFDTPNVASKNGDVWEINVPGLSNANDFSSFDVVVVVPPDFGQPTYIKPQQNLASLSFTKEQLGKSGISIGFGSQQVYQFDLTYHLVNTNVFLITTDIALPPTTNYQTIQLNSITPKPTNVILDTDGNWLARYTLLPSQKMIVTAHGLVQVSLYPQKQSLSPKDRKLYVAQQQYWQVDDNRIQEEAKQLKTPEAIYQYVVSHLTYDYSRVTGTQQRLGALSVLQNGSSAVCLEFTDLFVALARAAGIPAREVDGFAYTQNTSQRPLSLEKDVLHAWPEYYDDEKGEWVMVDPTWGNTTGGVDYFHVLDFDHVAFAIKGVSSTYPIPAGGYKLPGQEDVKDIAVSFSDQSIESLPTMATTLHIGPTLLSGFSTAGSLSLQNTGNVLFPPQIATVGSHVLVPLHSQLLLPGIPPFGHTDVSFAFKKTPFLTNGHDTITITLGGKVVSQQVSLVAFTRQQLVIGGIIIGVLCLIIFIIAATTRRISISR